MKTNQFALQAAEAFREFVSEPNFPCLGAKAAFNSDSQTIRVFDELGSVESTAEFAADLNDFRGAIGDYSSFIAIFERPRHTTEIEFERLFWKQLRLLHAHDADSKSWAPNVASDPADPHFSFSFGGQALYVIGMHADSSRAARRFPWPAMIFNPHEQFERLRAEGKWKHMQETIRERDRQLQGTINPMLSDFGEQSEARQYSGRVVEEGWRAPFEAASSGRCPFPH